MVRLKKLMRYPGGIVVKKILVLVLIVLALAACARAEEEQAPETVVTSEATSPDHLDLEEIASRLGSCPASVHIELAGESLYSMRFDLQPHVYVQEWSDGDWEVKYVWSLPDGATEQISAKAEEFALAIHSGVGQLRPLVTHIRTREEMRPWENTHGFYLSRGPVCPSYDHAVELLPRMADGWTWLKGNKLRFSFDRSPGSVITLQLPATEVLLGEGLVLEDRPARLEEGDPFLVPVVDGTFSIDYSDPDAITVQRMLREFPFEVVYSVAESNGTLTVQGVIAFNFR